MEIVKRAALMSFKNMRGTMQCIACSKKRIIYSFGSKNEKMIQSFLIIAANEYTCGGVFSGVTISVTAASHRTRVWMRWACALNCIFMFKIIL